MRELGLSPRKNKDPPANGATIVPPPQAKRSHPANSSKKQILIDNDDDTGTSCCLDIIDEEAKKYAFSASASQTASAQNSSSADSNKQAPKRTTKFSSNYYARRLSTLGLVTSKPTSDQIQASESQLNIAACRRKYSLDNHHLLPSKVMSASSNPANAAASFMKSLRQSNANSIQETKTKLEPQNLDLSSNFTRSRSFYKMDTPLPNNQCNMQQPQLDTSVKLNG